MNDCYCDYDIPEFYRSEIRRARKPHQCCECGAQIEPRDEYEYASGKYEGTMFSHKTCRRCYNLRMWVQNNVPCFCWAHCNMIDDAKGAISDAYLRAGNEVAGLRFGFARRVYHIEKYAKQHAFKREIA